MKRMIILICFSMLCVKPVYAGDTLKISAPPSIWVQQRGDSLEGPIISMISDIFNEINITVSSEVLPWARAIQRMKSGEIDMIPVIFYNDDRSQYMDFSIPYVEIPTVVFVPSGKKFQFNSFDDLIGKEGLMMSGDSISKEFHQIESRLSLTKVMSYKQIIKMLANNRADYAIAAKYGFIVEAKRIKMYDKVDILPIHIASRNIHIALSKKSKYLKYLPNINSKIEQYKTDGTMDNIINSALKKATDD